RSGCDWCGVDSPVVGGAALIAPVVIARTLTVKSEAVVVIEDKLVVRLILFGVFAALPDHGCNQCQQRRERAAEIKRIRAELIERRRLGRNWRRGFCHGGWVGCRCCWLRSDRRHRD